MKQGIYRVGIGYDIHRLVKGRRLFLGGVRFSYPKGLLGHSDADVLLHAICDALLGAASQGDIGMHFPDTDSRYKNIRSTELLKKVLRILKQKGLNIVNLDATVIAQAPKISAQSMQIKKNIAELLNLTPDKVNLKATTSEGVGEIGKNKAIAAWCVALLRGDKR